MEHSQLPWDALVDPKISVLSSRDKERCGYVGGGVPLQLLDQGQADACLLDQDAVGTMVSLHGDDLPLERRKLVTPAQHVQQVAVLLAY